MSEIKFLSCPFCGSEKLKINKKSKLYAYAAVGRIEHHTFSVRCNVCHARGGTVGGMVADGFCGEISKVQITTDDELKAAAIAAWNNRKPVEDALERLENNSYLCGPTYDIDGYSNDDEQEVILLERAIEIIKEELGGE